MLIDWFTLLAQIVNFLILIWLLKRFLYKPILNAIDEREKMIAGKLHEAEMNKADANRKREEYEQKNTEFDKQRQELLHNAIGEVNAERQKLLKKTRQEVQTLRLRLMETVKAEQQNLSSEIILRTRTEVFAIVRKTLTDLASVDLEEQIASVFIIRINELNPDERESLNSVLKKSSKELLVRSTFELPEKQQKAIQSAIETNFNIIVKINFETAPHLVSGIELIANGYKICWTIEDYLLSLENHIKELLDARSVVQTGSMI